MEAKLEEAILAEAAAAGIEASMSADEVVDAARDAFAQGSRAEPVVRILNLVDFDPEEPHSSDAPAQQVEPGASPAATPAKTQRFMGFPEPRPIADEEIPQIPADLTSVSDRELRRLQSAWSAVHSYALHVVGQAEAELAMVKQAYELKLKMQINAIPKIDASTGKQKPAGQVDAEAHQDEDVQRWKEKLTQLTSDLTIMKSLRDGYASNLAVISREWTMRHQSWEKERS